VRRLHLWTSQALSKFIERHREHSHERNSFKRTYGDGGSGVPKLEHLKNA
jgi:hypothetical protein